MTKHLEFETLEATYQDDDGDEHTTTIEVHRVTDETKGEYNTVAGVERAQKGDVLVKRDRPNTYDRIPGKVFDDLGYEKKSDHGGLDHNVNGL